MRSYPQSYLIRDRSFGTKPLYIKFSEPSKSGPLNIRVNNFLEHKVLRKPFRPIYEDKPKTSRANHHNIISEATSISTSKHSIQRDSESDTWDCATDNTGAAVASSLGMAAGSMLGSAVSTPGSLASEPSSPSNNHQGFLSSESSTSSSPVR